LRTTVASSLRGAAVEIALPRRHVADRLAPSGSRRRADRRARRRSTGRTIETMFGASTVPALAITLPVAALASTK
jgi:hypothetical protein